MTTTKALENAEAALGALEAFLAEPVRSERDRAGVIQAFEETRYRRALGSAIASARCCPDGTGALSDPRPVSLGSAPPHRRRR
jgi:hypothetical protein